MEQHGNISAGLLSLLPTIYTAWSDSIVGNAEMEQVYACLDQMDFLSPDEKSTIRHWTKPGKPPSESTFQSWIQIMRFYAHHTDTPIPTDTVTFGYQLASQIPNSPLQSFQKHTMIAQLHVFQKAIGLGDHANNNLLNKKIFHQNPIESNTHSLNTSLISSFFDGSYQNLKEDLRDILNDPTFKLKHIETKEEHRNQVLAWCHQLAKKEYGASAFPIEYKGGNDVGKQIIVMEMLGYHDLSLAIKFGVQFGLFAGSIYALGTKKHHDKYLIKSAYLDIAGCFAMTEYNHGSNVKQLDTTATYQHSTKTIIINTPHDFARKEYIGNALHGQMAVVFAQLLIQGNNYGVHAFIVPLKDTNGITLSGIRIEDCGYKSGLNGVDNGKIWFDHVSIPLENMLDQYGMITEDGNYKSQISDSSKRFFTMLSTLVAGRICISWTGLSAAKKSLHTAIHYAHKRKQFGEHDHGAEQLIIDYPSHQQRLFPLLAKTYALDFALKVISKEYVDKRNSGDFREIETLAAGLKVCSSWHVIHTSQMCREACGGKGYMWNSFLGNTHADTDVFATFEGDNTVLLQLISKSLLSQYRKEFLDSGVYAVFRIISENVLTGIIERNPYIIRKTDNAHLIDPEFHLDALSYRERSLLQSLASRMKSFIDKRIPIFEAFLKCQTHMITLANAHMEHYIVKSAYDHANSFPDSPEKETIHQLLHLHALDIIYADRGWFLEHDYLSPIKSKAIRRMMSKLVTDIKPHSVSLVDAFNIPKQTLTENMY